MMQFVNTPEDRRWLLDTALRGYEVPAFGSAIFTGNDDCPLTIDLYDATDPTVDDLPIARYELRQCEQSSLSHYVRL